MNILFLDIDGVVNRGRRALVGFNWADPECVRLLNNALSQTNAKVVISSSWRVGASLKELSNHFKNHFGIQADFIDMTPVINLDLPDCDFTCAAPRAMEIRDWLDRHPEVDNFAIIDDMDIFQGGEDEIVFEDQEIAEKFVRLPFFGGLDSESANKLKEILNKEKSQ